MREPLQEDGEPTFDLMYDFTEYMKHSFSLVTEDGECLMEWKKGTIRELPGEMIKKNYKDINGLNYDYISRYVFSISKSSKA